MAYADEVSGATANYGIWHAKRTAKRRSTKRGEPSGEREPPITRDLKSSFSRGGPVTASVRLVGKMRILATFLLHIFLLVFIAYFASFVGFILSVAGFVKIGDINTWTTCIRYVYLPLSGLVLGGALISFALSAKNVDNSLRLDGSEFGFKILKFWRYQNVVAALVLLTICLLAFVYSAGYYRGYFERHYKHSATRTAGGRN